MKGTKSGSLLNKLQKLQIELEILYNSYQTVAFVLIAMLAGFMLNVGANVFYENVVKGNILAEIVIFFGCLLTFMVIFKFYYDSKNKLSSHISLIKKFTKDIKK